MILKHLRFCLYAVILAGSGTVRAEAAAAYSFGIGPQQSASELAKRWTPILQYLSERSGINLQFRTAKDIPTFQQQMRDGTFDFAYINPYHYLLFRKSAGYTAFAHEREGKLIGVLVVHKDAKIRELAQLEGQTLAFPAPNALAATWLPLQTLKAQGVEVNVQYVNSMDSVYRSVAKGLFPAGGGELRTLGAIDPEIKSQLNILWTSESLPPFAFAAHPRVPKEIVMRVQKAMQEMEQQGAGQALLKAINIKGLEAANDSDYDAMRKLNIKPVDGH